MRVVHVIPSVGARRGGPSRVVLELARSQAARGARVTVLALDADLPRDEEAAVRAALGEGVSLILSRRVGPARLDLSPDFPLRALSPIARADVVHAHTVFTFPVAAAPPLCRALGVPCVIRPAGTLDAACLRLGGARGKALAVATYVRRNLVMADAVQATSPLEAAELSALAPRARVVVVEPGASPASRRTPRASRVAEGSPSTADRDDAGGRGWRVGTLGRLHPIKRVELLLEAVARLDDVELEIAGAGEPGYEASLRERARALGIEARVRWLGHVDEAGRAELLTSCDVLAFPSLHESFGVAVAEAMAAGRAVVVTPEVALAETIAAIGAGRVAEGSAASLAEAIGALLDDGPARRRAAQAGRAHAAQAWSSEAACARVEALYEGVLARRRSCSSSAP